MQISQGVVIVRKNKRYPEDAMIVADVMACGDVRVFPLGGGPEFKIPVHRIEEFRIVDPEGAAPIFEPAYFRIEDGPVFLGVTDGARWNGWEMPAFAKAEAMAVIAAFGGRYERGGDAFITFAADNSEERWPGQTALLANGEALHVYRIGAGAWTWDAVVH